MHREHKERERVDAELEREAMEREEKAELKARQEAEEAARSGGIGVGFGVESGVGTQPEGESGSVQHETWDLYDFQAAVFQPEPAVQFDVQAIAFDTAGVDIAGFGQELHFSIPPAEHPYDDHSRDAPPHDAHPQEHQHPDGDAYITVLDLLNSDDPVQGVPDMTAPTYVDLSLGESVDNDYSVYDAAAKNLETIGVHPMTYSFDVSAFTADSMYDVPHDVDISLNMMEVMTWIDPGHEFPHCRGLAWYERVQY